MKQYDVVRVTKDDQKIGITKGQIGTILEVYGDNHFEIEIIDENGETLFIGALSGEYIPLYSLENLEFIGLDSFIKAELDFKKLSQLKRCFITWNSKYKNLFEVSTLNHLIIDKYPYEDLLAMSKLSDLETLDITSRNLHSLHGIEYLNKLHELKLYKCSNLVDLNGIQYLTELKTLDIHTCRKINNLNGCEKLVKLEKIYLENCKEIDSLNLLKHCKQLRRIYFIGDTVVDDGDFSELIKLPLLTDLWFTERKHYTLKMEEVYSLLQKN